MVREIGEGDQRQDLVQRLQVGEHGGEMVPQRAQRGLAEYFRQAALLDGSTPDPRVADAIEMVRAARQPDGTWLQAGRRPGRVWFEVDVPAGEPSKWPTLFGTRVLDWLDRSVSRSSAAV